MLFGILENCEVGKVCFWSILLFVIQGWFWLELYIYDFYVYVRKWIYFFGGLIFNLLQEVDRNLSIWEWGDEFDVNSQRVVSQKGGGSF